MAVTLTLQESGTLSLLRRYNTGILRGHKTPNGKPSYRLLDARFNPIANIETGVINSLIAQRLIKVTAISGSINDQSFIVQP